MQRASWGAVVAVLLFASVLTVAVQHAYAADPYDYGAQAAAAAKPSTHKHPKGHKGKKTHNLARAGGAAAAKPSNASDDVIVYSSLWGLDGSNFEQGFRMFDPSWAGYKGGYRPPQSGEARLIDIVAEFGAVPNDDASDSEALAAAVASAEAYKDPHKFTVIYFRSGTYIMSQNITISKPIVLRGAGRDSTRIKFEAPMHKLYPGVYKQRKVSGAPASPWSFRHMFWDFQGVDSLYAPEDQLAALAMPTVPGSRVITVSSTEGIEAGMKVRIVAKDPGDGSLVRYLYGDGQATVSMDITDLTTKAQEGHLEGEDAVDPIRFVSRVLQVFPATNQLLLKRAIPYALELRWSPAVMKFEPKLQNVGVEGFTLEHKWSKYPGHFKELGHNTLGFVRVSNCWARNLRILNADTAIATEYSHFCSFDNVEIGVTASRSDLPNIKGISCHHGFSMGHSADILLSNFQVLTRCEHDISWDWFTTSSVAANGRGVDLNNDMHRSAPHGNLISNVSCGLCSRPFASGGAKNRGLNAGMKNTFWNLRPGPSIDLLSSHKGKKPAAAAAQALIATSTGFDLPLLDWGLYLNFVGCSFKQGMNDSNLAASGSQYSVVAGSSDKTLVPKTVAQDAASAQDLRGTWLIENVSPWANERLQPQCLYTAFRDIRHARARRDRMTTAAAAAAQMLMPAAT